MVRSEGVALKVKTRGKDSRPDANGLLTTTDGTPVATATATESASVWELAEQEDDVLRGLQDFSFLHNGQAYFLQVSGFVRSYPCLLPLLVYAHARPVCSPLAGLREEGGKLGLARKRTHC